jgi:RimJ/RimL family protein N-acetyltransferase
MEKIFPTPPGQVASRSDTPTLPERGVWRVELPVLASRSVGLREPVPGEAAALVTAIGVSDLAWLDEPSMPPTVAGLEAFLADLPRRRATGELACWAVVPAGIGSPVGLVVVRGLDPGFSMVEATAVLAEEYRGSGLFSDAARLVLDCLFGVMRVHRIEARVDVVNARAHGALRKAGATQEGVLRQARLREGAFRDHVLWALVGDDWTARRDGSTGSVH